jgi:alkaline phosphatase
MCVRSRRSICVALLFTSLGIAGAVRADDQAAAIETITPAATSGTDTGTAVILMISDGGGFNTWAATSMYQGRVGSQLVDQPGWTRIAVSTYSLRRSPAKPVEGAGGLEQDAALVYSSSRAWDDTPVDGELADYPDHFAGYRWHKETYPDSANTASALVTGVKSYNGAINVDGNGKKLDSLATLARAVGKRAGVATSVPISHATPAAAGGAHNFSRANTAAIANEMLSAGVLSFIAGAGHPEYSDDAQPRDAAQRKYNWIGGEPTWRLLNNNTHPKGWTLVTALDDIRMLSAGPTPERLLILGRVSETFQQGRRSLGDARTTGPGVDARNEGVPTLPLLSGIALNALENPKGFFLMIEGGAVDWAMHSNQLGRMIEEHSEFIEAVETVAAALDAGAHGRNWSNTLLVVTADHDHLLWGPNSDRVAFEPLQDRGKGNMPGHKWHFNSHSNSLVPLFAKGVGSERFAALATKADTHTLRDGRRVGRGAYLDQTEVFTVMRDTLVMKTSAKTPGTK